MNEVRLLKGSTMLGELWKKQIRCQNWSVDCSCETPTQFCEGKKLWLRLAVEDKREIDLGEYGILMTMTASELDATGLQVTVDLGEGVGQVTVGGGKSTIKMRDLWKLSTELPEVFQSTLLVMKAFPGAKVEVPDFAKRLPPAAPANGL